MGTNSWRSMPWVIECSPKLIYAHYYLTATKYTKEARTRNQGRKHHVPLHSFVPARILGSTRSCGSLKDGVSYSDTTVRIHLSESVILCKLCLQSVVPEYRNDINIINYFKFKSNYYYLVSQNLRSVSVWRIDGIREAAAMSQMVEFPNFFTNVSILM